MSGPARARCLAGLGLTFVVEATDIEQSLSNAALPTINLQDNELAKLHIRHLVGGRCHLAEHEQLYRFEFPERPGALLKFLTRAGGRWNISLFHYRNHAAAFGRVLAGVEVPPEDRTAFESYLDELGYPYVNESENPAYALFLK